MTQEQLQQLIAALRGPNTAGVRVGAAAMVVRLGSCELGRDKLKRFKKFTDWVGEAESKIRLLGLTTDTQKNSFVQSSAGPELTQYWEKEARIRWEATLNPAQAAHMYEELI